VNRRVVLTASPRDMPPVFTSRGMLYIQRTSTLEHKLTVRMRTVRATRFVVFSYLPYRSR
jgi:hypothetical protein